MIGERKSLYRKYFVRHPERYESEALTEKEILALIYIDEIYPRLKTEHFKWLFTPSIAYEYLQKLFDLGYVDRIEACRYWDGGLVYGLTNKGDRVVAQKKNRRPSRADLGRKNRIFSVSNLRHDQLTASLRVSLLVAARKHPYLNVLYDKTLLNYMPDAARKRSNPFRLHATIQTESGPVEVSTRDDGSYVITDAREGKQYRDQGFLSEIDGFTETIESEAYDISQAFNPKIFSHKVEFILNYAREKRHVEQFGVEPLRALIPVADSPETGAEGALERLGHMVETVMKITDGEGSTRFMFIPEQNLTPDRIFKDDAWIDGTGNLTGLLKLDTENLEPQYRPTKPQKRQLSMSLP